MAIYDPTDDLETAEGLFHGLLSLDRLTTSPGDLRDALAAKREKHLEAAENATDPDVQTVEEKTAARLREYIEKVEDGATATDLKRTVNADDTETGDMLTDQAYGTARAEASAAIREAGR